MLIETSKLTGPVLDWAVAKCVALDAGMQSALGRFCSDGWPFEPSTAWAHAGPIIEREKIDIGIDWDDNNRWIAGYSILTECMDFEQIGSTPLIAAMRCYVASKLGDEVEIPEELCV